jgi:uncharacterized protein (DUF1499 family)
MQTKSRSSVTARAGLFIAVIAGLAALFSGLGTRYGIWEFRTGITLLRWAAYGGIAGVALSLIGVFTSLRIVMVRSFLLALLGVLIGGVLAGFVLHWKQVAESVPRIHDITTDTGNPPQFVAIPGLLRSGENTHVYGGSELAGLQKKAYPDIVPLILPELPDQAFEKALAAARRLGWQIIDADSDAGRIEAVDTTFWFGFKDDVVIRIRRLPSGSRVDIRSVSRVGVSDLGKNAERIRKFLRAVQGPK